MKNIHKLSPIEQAAMEQSPSNEIDIRYNYEEHSHFIGKLKHIVHTIVETTDHTKTVVKTAKTFVQETEETAADGAAGGVIREGYLSPKYAQLIDCVDQECSIEELIDLRKALTKAIKHIK